MLVREVVRGTNGKREWEYRFHVVYNTWTRSLYGHVWEYCMKRGLQVAEDDGKKDEITME